MILESRTNPFEEVVFESIYNRELIKNLTDKLKYQLLKFKEQIEFKRNKEFLYRNKIIRRFYYFRDDKRLPKITVCVIYDPKQKMYHRGIAIRNETDIIDKEEGRDIAEKRAVDALLNAKTMHKINRSCIFEIMEEEFKYKSDYNVSLTIFEKKLFKEKSII